MWLVSAVYTSITKCSLSERFAWKKCKFTKCVSCAVNLAFIKDSCLNSPCQESRRFVSLTQNTVIAWRQQGTRKILLCYMCKSRCQKKGFVFKWTSLIIRHFVLGNCMLVLNETSKDILKSKWTFALTIRLLKYYVLVTHCIISFQAIEK